MFKVECPGCKAPYQVDERRIPSSGLKMRCPKCGTSFKVDPPDDGRRTGPSPVLGGALGMGAEGESMPPPALSSPSPRGAAGLKGTMVGVAPATAAPRPAPAANLKGTMLGVAPAGAAAPPAPPRPAPAANLKGTMLGVAPAAGVVGKPPPMPVRKAPAQPKPAPDAFSDLDLPAVGRAPGAPRAPQPSDADLPAPLAPQPFDDLPAPLAPQAFDDLPVAAAPHAAGALDIELDLPSLGGRASDAKARTASQEIELDLPTVGGPRSRAPAPAMDLPSISLRPPEPWNGQQSSTSP